MRRMQIAGLLILMALLAAGTVHALADDFKREQGRNGRKDKDALEGKSPPRLDVTGWLNTGGKPLDLEKLRGKVIVLEFWGVW